MKNTHKITLLNDDVNSYDYVIASLIRICEHNIIQAEQCAMITDRVGKCDIKIGNVIDMQIILNKLEALDLKVEINIYEGQMY